MTSFNPQTWVGWTVLMRLKNPPVALTGKIERLVPGENVTLVNGKSFPLFVSKHIEDKAPPSGARWMVG